MMLRSSWVTCHIAALHREVAHVSHNGCRVQPEEAAAGQQAKGNQEPVGRVQPTGGDQPNAHITDGVGEQANEACQPA